MCSCQGPAKFQGALVAQRGVCVINATTDAAAHCKTATAAAKELLALSLSLCPLSHSSCLCLSLLNSIKKLNTLLTATTACAALELKVFGQLCVLLL